MSEVRGSLQVLSASDGRTGLVNLGNSCYMNSALQCLLHIPELNYYFSSGRYKDELNRDNPLGNGGRIAEVFAQLIHHLFMAKRSHQPSFSPRDFKMTIGRFNSMFSSYHQQDSQEFLSYLLDGLHEDLNRVCKKPYTEKPELTNTERATEAQVRELAQNSWDTHRLRNDSVINDLFVGLYKSTLVCPECHKSSVTFDPYNALTLPLPTDQSWSHKVLVLFDQGYPKSFEVELTKKATFNSLKNYLSLKLDIPVTELICMEIFNHQFFKNYESSDADINYMPIDGLIQKDDLIVFYQLKHSPGDYVVPVFSTVTGGSDVKPFGIPFFITLSEEDRFSFGAIREKLENRYDQLSTYNYFTQVRSKQKTYHTIKDFPALEAKLAGAQSESCDDQPASDLDGYESDISLANPDIPGDYAFSVKLFDSSKEMKPKYGAYYTDDDDHEIADDELWVPKTCNNFKNLPSLLDQLPERKRAFYTYNENSFEDSGTSKDAADDDEFPGLDEAVDTMDDSASETAAPDVEEPQQDSKSAQDQDEDMSSEDSGPALGSLLDSSTDLVTPSTGSSDNKFKAQEPTDAEMDPKPLVSEKIALVCEWKQDLFDIFFTGIEEEGEGGKGTWLDPEEVPNHELLEKRERERARNQDATNITLYDCLKLFEQPEILSDQDLWYCPSCKRHTKATKTLEVWSTPDILTIHLKRFESQRSLSDKIDDIVEFPIEGLDLAPYIVSNDGTDTVYDLFAVDNHYGGLGGGHYTAFVKNFVDGTWYYFDDSRVHPRDPQESVAGSAYLLFYRRRKRDLGNEYLQEIVEKEKQRQAAELEKDLERIEKLRAELEEQKRLEDLAAQEKKDAEDAAGSESDVGAEDAPKSSPLESINTPAIKSPSSSATSTTIVPVSETFAPQIVAPLPHHPTLQETAFSNNTSGFEGPTSGTTKAPLRKKRKGNISSPVLTPALPYDDANVESDLESVKGGAYSPGLVPTSVSSGGKAFHSSTLVDSPISMYDNDAEDDEDDRC